MKLSACGLLHDIGKIFQRANRIKKSHAAIGEEVLRPYISQELKILHAVIYRTEMDTGRSVILFMKQIIWRQTGGCVSKKGKGCAVCSNCSAVQCFAFSLQTQRVSLSSAENRQAAMSKKLADIQAPASVYQK